MPRFHCMLISVLAVLQAGPACFAAAVLMLQADEDKSPAGPGDVITYTLTCSNTGATVASGAILQAAIPPGTTLLSADGGAAAGPNGLLTWPAIGLGAGGLVVERFSVAVGAGAIDGSSLEMDASISDAASDAATASAVAAVQSNSPLAVALTANPSPVFDGTPVIYAIAVSNRGSTPLNNVAVSLALPGDLSASPSQASPVPASVGNVNGRANYSWLFPSLGAGQSAAILFSPVTSIAFYAPPNGTSLQAVASAACPGVASAQASASVVVTSAPALMLQADQDKFPAAPGDAVTYTLTCSNAGSAEIAGAVIQGRIPPGTTFLAADGGVTPNSNGLIEWPAASLGPGKYAVETFRVTVEPGASDGSFLEMDASASDAARDVASASAIAAVRANSSLAVSVVANPNLVIHGAPVTYEIIASNFGNSALSGVSVNMTLPAYLLALLVQANPEPASNGDLLGGNILSWTFPSVAAGQRETILFSPVTLVSPNGISIQAVVTAASAGATSAQASASVVLGTVVASSLEEAATGSSPLTFEVFNSVQAPPGSSLAAIVGKPKYGRIVVHKNGTFTYTPEINFAAFAGADIITYTVDDGTIVSAPATITIGNPYYLQRGTFAGLIEGSSCLQLTLTSLGSFTGKLRVGTKSFPFTGRFPETGEYSGKVAGMPLTLDIAVTLPASPLSGATRISGSLNADGEIANPFSIYHIASGKRGSAPQAGLYTLLLPPAAPVTEAIPSGVGFARLTVNRFASVAMIGVLADGTPFSLGASLVGSGGASFDSLPIFVSLPYSPKGLLSGTMKFESLSGSDLDGGVGWFKPAQKNGAFCRGGFTTLLPAVGSRYLVPGKGTLALNLGSASPNATVTLKGQGFSESPQVTVEPGRTATADSVAVNAATPGGFAMSINAAAGTFSGSFLSPATSRVTGFKGVLFQKQAMAGGCFLSAGQSGSVTLQPIP